jgi:hypothetical protein
MTSDQRGTKRPQNGKGDPLTETNDIIYECQNYGICLCERHLTLFRPPPTFRVPCRRPQEPRPLAPT